MRHINTFQSFVKSVNEKDEDNSSVTKKLITLEFDIDWNENIGKVKQDVTLAMSPSSLGMYELGNDIEKFTGLPKADAEAAKETPDDAFVYGMCNIMNGGKDIFQWHNGTRLAGEAKKIGIWPAIFEQLSHESVHLARIVLSKHIFEPKYGYKAGNEWYIQNLQIGDDPETNLVDEESFATVQGLIVQKLVNEFLNMASTYIPELKNKM
jgi:hypothetical protein